MTEIANPPTRRRIMYITRRVHYVANGSNSYGQFVYDWSVDTRIIRTSVKMIEIVGISNRTAETNPNVTCRIKEEVN